VNVQPLAIGNGAGSTIGPDVYPPPSQEQASPARSPEMAGKYTPADHEPAIHARWASSRAFAADPGRVLSGEAEPYCILIPPPNVTGALHLGHAFNNTIQDMLCRAHRMKGYETLWMPGTDHAGIATQAVVDKRLIAEGKPALADYKRQQLADGTGRDEFIGKVHEWKDEYLKRITDQLRAMGCSCDWDRQRFTMDEVCARSVREAFFQLFKAGLIYRGKRLVNWDPVSQTALADDEVEMEEVESFFWYLKYPIVDDAGNETGEHVTVATTRPETYFGDTAIAVNPKDPDRMHLIGKRVKLPFVGRTIPIIGDDYVVMPDAESSDAKAKYASGFLKVTPAHDPNDWDIGQRHDLPIINIMAPDASISDAHGWEDVGEATWAIGKSREDARKLVEEKFAAEGLLADKKPYTHSVGHSYRSHAIVEPYLSDQWYVKVTDDRLRGEAQRALSPEQRTQKSLSEWPESAPVEHSVTATDGSMTFYPPRYAKSYESWHDNLRDWCISRQLWWGHRIPVWGFQPARVGEYPYLSDSEATRRVFGIIEEYLQACGLPTTSVEFREVPLIPYSAGVDGRVVPSSAATDAITWLFDRQSMQDATRFAAGSSIAETFGQSAIEAASRFSEAVARTWQDPDVLDTWFSSALWPLSTMGWPQPKDDTVDLLGAFNPTSVLCTAREIITLWVSRMVMFNRFFTGDEQTGTGQVPFTNVFIHAMIQDGEGRKMSKSLGNGVDPLDIIHTHGTDALRFTLAQMTTQTQDVRMPVEFDEATGKNTSPKFDLGRNFCNKLWNASRFVITMLGEHAAGDGEFDEAKLTLPDRWILSRLDTAIKACDQALESYQFSTYAQTLYDLLWRDYCDWYVEAVKPTLKTSPTQQAVLRSVLDAILRLLHPITPFVTESIFDKLRQITTADVPGLSLSAPRRDGLLCLAGWPKTDGSLHDEQAEAQWARVQGLIGVVREVRSQQQIKPRQRITLHVPEAARSTIEPILETAPEVIEFLAGIGTVSHDDPTTRAVDIRCEGLDLRLSQLSDEVDTGAELERLTRELAAKAKSIAAMEGRLANPGYSQKAPPHLVQQTRDQLEQAKKEHAALASALERLS